MHPSSPCINPCIRAQTLLCADFNHISFVTQETWLMLMDLPLPSGMLPCKNPCLCFSTSEVGINGNYEVSPFWMALLESREFQSSFKAQKLVCLWCFERHFHVELWECINENTSKTNGVCFSSIVCTHWHAVHLLFTGKKKKKKKLPL